MTSDIQIAAVLAARLEVCREHADRTDDTRPLELLLDRAGDELSPHHELFFLIECVVEEKRSIGRSPQESARVWERLEERAAIHLPPGHPTFMRIRSFRGRYSRLRGEPGDMDRGIAFYEEELERRVRLKGKNAYATSMACGNLGYALLCRGRLEDLLRARNLLTREAEARATEYGPDTEFAGTARGNLGRTLLRLYDRTEQPDPDLLVQALEIAEGLKSIRGRRYGRDYYMTLSAHLLCGHALMLMGRKEDAVREIRYVQVFESTRGIRVERAWLLELSQRLELEQPADPPPYESD